MWICAHIPLHGTSHGKLLIWLNLGCKGTHGGRLWNCNLSELHFSSLISLLAFLERLCLFFHKTTHSFLPRCKGRSPKRKFQSREEFFRGAVVSSLLIALAQALRLYLLKSSFHLTFQVKFSTHKPERADSVLCRCPTVFDPLAATLRLRARIAASKTSPGTCFDFSTSQCDGIGGYFWVALCLVWTLQCKDIIMWANLWFASIKRGSGVVRTP